VDVVLDARTPIKCRMSLTMSLKKLEVHDAGNTHCHAIRDSALGPTNSATGLSVAVAAAAATPSTAETVITTTTATTSVPRRTGTRGELRQMENSSPAATREGMVIEDDCSAFVGASSNEIVMLPWLLLKEEQNTSASLVASTLDEAVDSKIGDTTDDTAASTRMGVEDPTCPPLTATSRQSVIVVARRALPDRHSCSDTDKASAASISAALITNAKAIVLLRAVLLDETLVVVKRLRALPCEHVDALSTAYKTADDVLLSIAVTYDGITEVVLTVATSSTDQDANCPGVAGTAMVRSDGRADPSPNVMEADTDASPNTVTTTPEKYPSEVHRRYDVTLPSTLLLATPLAVSEAMSPS
jgi:hypothetical protein